MKWKKREEPGYAEARKRVLKRDKHTCQMPGCSCKNRRKLQVHHILEYAKYTSVRQSDDNLITLCITCHKSIRGKERHYVTMFNNIIRNKK